MSYQRLVQIGLENAIDTIHWAIHPDIEDIVSTTMIFSCPWARLKKTSPVPAEVEVLFGLGKIYWIFR
jgi:hypothetical protein